MQQQLRHSNSLPNPNQLGWIEAAFINVWDNEPEMQRTIDEIMVSPPVAALELAPAVAAARGDARPRT